MYLRPSGTEISQNSRSIAYARTDKPRRLRWVWLLLFAAVVAVVPRFGSSGFGWLLDSSVAASSETSAESQPPTAEVESAIANESEGDSHDDHSEGHTNPVAPVLLAISLILLLAKVAGDLFERFRMPAVLGELFVGILLGNCLFLTGWEGLEFLKAPPADKLSKVLLKVEKRGLEAMTAWDRQVLAAASDRYEKLEKILLKSERQEEMSLSEEDHEILKEASQRAPYQTGAILKLLASIGVVLLLFEVGLESTVKQMLSVGVSSSLVAILGVVVPMALGAGAGWLLIREQGWQVHAFIGATLCATSVGITARVLKDLGRSQQRESQIILGAAVIDDVLGLVVLAIVSGVIRQGELEIGSLMIIILKAFGFLVGAIVLGRTIISRPLFLAASTLRGHGLLVATALVICFSFSWLANFMGLDPIVGAFAAGLILEETHYRELGDKEQHKLETALAPLTGLFVPIFFVQMGIQVELASFLDQSVWILAAVITIVAIIGKQICALGVREEGLNRMAVGLGMIPRGEVGLIFAQVGRDLEVEGVPVIGDATYSAIVVMVMVTTMVTPPLLKWAMAESGSESGTDPPLADHGESNQ